MNKSTSHTPQISRPVVTSWLHSLLPDVPATLKIEELGKGSIYCRVINYYFPGAILVNRIILHPKSQYESTINLKILQNAMAQLRINIPIDPIKLSKEKLNDNWAFITALYKYLTHTHEDHNHHHSVPQKEQKNVFGFYPSNHNNNSHTTQYTHNPKRSIQQVYPQHHYFPSVNRPPLQPLYQFQSNIQQKNSFYGAGKYSVGKMYKQNTSTQVTNSPNKGKWSVNSLMFQNNLMPIIDRIKEILIKSSHDTEKIRQIKMLLNIPLNEEVAVKVEEDEEVQITMINPAPKCDGKQSKSKDDPEISRNIAQASK